MHSNLKEIRKKSIFIDGPVHPEIVANEIKKHQLKKHIGAYDMFLGQVRNDLIEGKTVQSIHYSAFEEMAEEITKAIRNEAFEKYSLTCLHIYHSLGNVNAGEICLFVFITARHRKHAFDACRFVVEEIKNKLPVWGKEVFTDDSYIWKVNT